MRRVALLLVLLGCRRSSPSPASLDAGMPLAEKEIPVVVVPTDFFPPDTFESNEAFITDWYGKQLEAMHEPSLWAATARGQTVYRFLWLRSFHKPIAVRVSVAGGRVHLVATRSSGAGGYSPGVIDVQRERDLTLGDLGRIETALDASGFDTMKPRGGASGADGARWIVERAKNGTYHLVDRWSPDRRDPFAEACNVFLDLAGRDLIIGPVY